MDAKDLAAAAAIAASVALAVAVVATKEDPPPQDVKQLSAELLKGTIPVATVYKVDRSDGGAVYASKYGKTVIYLDESPCASRPAGVKASTCTKLDGGDPGDSNTMQAGQWVGAGCVRKACVIMAGEAEK